MKTELISNHCWREEDGVIYFDVTSDGATGEEWINRLKSKGCRVSGDAKILLRSADFKPTNGVPTEVAVLKGIIFKDADRSNKKIREEAANRKLYAPNIEIACLIREMFTDEKIRAMGIRYLTIMHKPIKDSDGDLSLLGTGRSDEDGWLMTNYDNPDGQYRSNYGFAFAVH